MDEEIDPSTIEDERLRKLVRSLMNLVEDLSTTVRQQADEIQRLRDENQRLKGEQGQPKIRKASQGKAALWNCPEFGG